MLFIFIANAKGGLLINSNYSLNIVFLLLFSALAGALACALAFALAVV